MADLRQAAQQALEAPGCERLREWASIGPVQRAAVESFLHAALEQPEPPPEAQTEAEKIAYCAGWWAAMAAKAKEQPEQKPHLYVYEYDGPFGLHREFYPRPYNGRKPDRTIPVFTHPPRRDPLPVQPTAAMIEAGAQRLVSWEDDSTWPDSWSALQVAAARNDAERVWRSMWLAA